ncbi:peptidyl-prolyl cis-trans isomerase, rhodopsin-specific isozyme [Chironomus tepperi]|uniref:peptidyl-prolyl cis-trans isomerase, rhodopsin-specific isozyme n=1 Tax=Chironomus tepperi TaxID=113505 RepID=UPI00391FAA5C
MKANVALLFYLIFIPSVIYSAQFRVTSHIYFDVAHGKNDIGRIVIGLFGDDAPKTVENFRHICTKGIDGLSYNGTRFHRVIFKFMIQGGDILKGDGAGSISIYGKHFEDENMTINHTAPGFLGMANHGPDTNGCQFYITTVPAPWLNGKHTVFGKVIDGQEWIHVIERVKTTTDDEPFEPVMLSSCGELELSKPYWTSDNPYDIWGWVKASSIPLTMSFTILTIFQYFIKKLDKYS